LKDQLGVFKKFKDQLDTTESLGTKLFFKKVQKTNGEFSLHFSAIYAAIHESEFVSWYRNDNSKYDSVVKLSVPQEQIFYCFVGGNEFYGHIIRWDALTLIFYSVHGVWSCTLVFYPLGQHGMILYNYRRVCNDPSLFIILLLHNTWRNWKLLC
jgi:hypothetical protein